MTIPKPFELGRPATQASVAQTGTATDLRLSTNSSTNKSSLNRQVSQTSLATSKSLAKSSIFQASTTSKQSTKTPSVQQPKPPVEQSLKVVRADQDLHRKKKQEVQASIKLDGEDELRYLHKKLKSIKIYTTKFD